MNFNTDLRLWEAYNDTRKIMVQKGQKVETFTVKEGAVYRNRECIALFSNQEDAVNTLTKAGFKSLGNDQWE